MVQKISLTQNGFYIRMHGDVEEEHQFVTQLMFKPNRIARN